MMHEFQLQGNIVSFGSHRSIFFLLKLRFSIEAFLTKWTYRLDKAILIILRERI